MTIGLVRTTSICAATRSRSPTISARLWSRSARSSVATFGLSERLALAQQHEETAELGAGQRGVPRLGRFGERAAFPRHLTNTDRGRTAMADEEDGFSVLFAPLRRSVPPCA